MRMMLTKWGEVTVVAFIFIVAFTPRFMSLGNTIFSDERLWIDRSIHFMKALQERNWTDTFITAHPGVTTMCLAGTSLSLFSTTGILEKLYTASVPIMLLTALSVVLAYFLLRKIFGREIAFIGSIFMAMDPFLIAHSRIVHLDAVLASFMMLATISLLAYLNSAARRYLLFSGIFTGLALLTKVPSFFLFPFSTFAVIV